MFKIIKNVIESQDYKLEDILEKIKVMYVEDKITKIQKDELDKLAREKAKAENSYDIQRQLNNIFARLEALENHNKETENTDSTENETEPTEPIEEYLEYVQPTGAHDSYKIGDKVLYNNKKYNCIMDNCVWAPDVYPAGWELVEKVQTTEPVEESEE